MLRCKGNRIYTGYAVDVQARYEEHCNGRGAKFTKAFPPEGVLRTFELETREEALRLEARIKKLKRPQKELLAAGDSELESGLRAGLGAPLKSKKKRSAKSRNATMHRTKSISSSNLRQAQSPCRCCKR